MFLLFLLWRFQIQRPSEPFSLFFSVDKFPNSGNGLVSCSFYLGLFFKFERAQNLRVQRKEQSHKGNTVYLVLNLVSALHPRDAFARLQQIATTLLRNFSDDGPIVLIVLIVLIVPIVLIVLLVLIAPTFEAASKSSSMIMSI